MRVLVDSVLAADATGGGLDLGDVLRIPAAIVAALALLALVRGIRYPFGLKATVVNAGSQTTLVASVRNRRTKDRTIDGLVLAKRPGLVERTFNPRWARTASTAEIVPYGFNSVVLGSWDRTNFEVELAKPGHRGKTVSIPKGTVVYVIGGDQTSRPKKVPAPTKRS